MPAFADSIRAKLSKTSPFTNFDYQAYPRDLQGTGGNDALRKAFESVQPQLLVEVGTWKGASAIFWANLMRQHNIDGAVLCVDTWLGGIEHMMETPAGWEMGANQKHGYSTLYYQFLANVMHEGLQDYIVPFPNTSSIGARWIQVNGLRPALIYIDASHEEDDVYRDIIDYWKILPYGGILCGDDFSTAWLGVVCAVNRFMRERDLEVQLAKTNWIIPKRYSIESMALLERVRYEMQQPRDPNAPVAG